ncbi:MAG: hypothetical protein K2H09_07335, partial [Treponemataceae bacterium]|nr:hypothetical protein [Treponemataceae bacterium]
MKNVRAFAFFLTCAFLSLCAAPLSASPAAGTYGSQQLLPAGHWMYGALFMLNAEAGRTTLADDAPLSIGELRMHFSEIDYESLSESGRKLYGQAMEFFSRKKFAARLGPVTLGFNVRAAPELLYKGGAVDWTFATDYTGDGENHEISALVAGRFASKTDSDGNPWTYSTGTAYGAASSFSGNEWTQPFITLPLYIG